MNSWIMQALAGMWGECMSNTFSHTQHPSIRVLGRPVNGQATMGSVAVLCSSLFSLSQSKSGMQRADDMWAGDTLAIDS